MPHNGHIISRWHTLVENFQTSPLDFYNSVAEALRAREVPQIVLSQIDWKEGGALSADRTYLRVTRGSHTFDICAAPFGKSFFFSWWLRDSVSPFGLGFAIAGVVATILVVWMFCKMFGFGPGIFLSAIFGPLALYGLGFLIHSRVIEGEDQVMATPVLGSLYERFFHPYTYFRFDSALMFQESVRAAVVEVINRLRDEQGLRLLLPEETMPHLRDLAA